MKGKIPVLLVVDMQNGFVDETELAVPGGREIVPIINRLMPLFPVVVATQDWHPYRHGSFYTEHPGAAPYDMGELGGMPQVLWPVHCVQGSAGADFIGEIRTEYFQAIIRKGMDPRVDSYSTFYDNHHQNPSGLKGYLRERGVNVIFLAGLALDYCVRYSARDARELTSEIYVIEDATRGVAEETIKETKAEFDKEGIKLIRSEQVEKMLGEAVISDQ